jgi:hypothetical protein
MITKKNSEIKSVYHSFYSRFLRVRISEERSDFSGDDESIIVWSDLTD